MYELYYQPFLDSQNKCYKTGFCISPPPSSTTAPILFSISKQRRLEPLSIFSEYRECDCNNTCVNLLINPNTKMPYTECESSQLINFLTTSGVKIDYDLTKIRMKQKSKLFLVVLE